MSTGKITPQFLDELKARLPVSQVVGRKVKLKKAGKDWVGLSPFTNEKTPSFYAVDEKRFWKCFSSGKQGDIIAFVEETENLSFVEAVEKLAAEAGMEVPKAAPVSKEMQDRQERLYRWMELAAQYFESQLRSPAGLEARQYLARRGLGPEACARHRIGYAPDGWQNLIDHLTAQGARQDELVEVDLAVLKDGRERAYDRFRDRVIFPIEDVRGRVVAFGGRAIDPDVKPKYLNSAETPLFHKGHQLYNYRQARKALANNKADGLIVCEGYMDVIALSEAGFEQAVAPLGTALTEDQLRLIWQAGLEPILCFDGDAAGLRAAHAAVERALPHLQPGQSLFFVLLPDGQDPDDIVRTRGPQIMRELLDGAMPLVDLLWIREREREALDTPERQAGLTQRLVQAAGLIRHGGVRAAYERELKARARELFYQMRRARSAPQRGPGGKPLSSGVKAALNARSVRLRGMGLLVKCVETPDLLDAALEPLALAEFPDADVARVRDGIFDVIEACGKVDRTALTRHLRNLGNKRAVRLLNEYPAAPPLDLSGPEGRDWLNALEQFAAAVGLREETARVREAKHAEGDVVDFARHHAERRRLAAARHALRTRIQEAAENSGLN